MENVHLHVGGRPIVPVCDGVDQRLANRVLGKLQALIPSVDVRDQRRVQLGLGVGDALLVDGVEVAREVLEVEDVSLGHAPQQSARHRSLQTVPGDVLRQQPCAGMRHLPVPDEMQVLQRDQRLQAVGDASALGEARPCFRRQVALQIEARAGRLVETDESFLVEGLADLVAGHLLAVRAFTDVEPATEGVGLAMLLRHRHDQYVRRPTPLDRDRRIRGACGGLDLRLQPVVVFDSDSITLVGDAKQDDSPSGVRERTDLGAEVGREGALELGGEAFAEGGQTGQFVLAHADLHPLTYPLGVIDGHSRKARLSSPCRLSECRDFRLRSGGGSRIVAPERHGVESTFTRRGGLRRATSLRARRIAVVKP